MTPKIKIINRNEEGYAVMVVLLVLVVLTLIGIAATTTSNIEVQISGNAKKIAEDFYKAEGGMIDALENTDGWLDDPFLVAQVENASSSGNHDFDDDGTDDALVEIRCIHSVLDGADNPIGVSGLSSMANDLPVDRHISKPPAGSGSSARHFIIRKYGVTSRALRKGELAGAPVQTGVWKLFNRYE